MFRRCVYIHTPMQTLARSNMRFPQPNTHAHIPVQASPPRLGSLDAGFLLRQSGAVTLKPLPGSSPSSVPACVEKEILREQAPVTSEDFWKVWLSTGGWFRKCRAHGSGVGAGG